jgi:hypothetical protein
MPQHPYRVLVCGGRRFNDALLLNRTLTEIAVKCADEGRSVRIAHGNADGADSLADRWAEEANVPREPFNAEWARYGRAAGPMRNARMLGSFKPHLVVAFEGGAGTEDMVRKAKAAGVPVLYAM